MSLFNFGKKKEKVNAPCCACNGCDCESAETNISDNTFNTGDGSTLSIKVLGAGCKSCHEQYEYAKEAVNNLGLSAQVEYITDLQKVMEYGVISVPAIVINDKVVSMGKVLKTADVERILNK